MPTGNASVTTSTRQHLEHLFGEAEAATTVSPSAGRPMTMDEYVRYTLFPDTHPTGQQPRQPEARTGTSTPPDATPNSWSGSGQVRHPPATLPLHLTLHHDAAGRIIAKAETTAAGTTTHQYGYDAQGRLTLAMRNDQVTEQYAYNEAGQRIQDGTAWRGERHLTYDDAGRLVQAGNVRYEYTPQGSLLCRTQLVTPVTELTPDSAYSGADTANPPATSSVMALTTRYQYGADTRLNNALLPDGTLITYRYSSSPDMCLPVEKHVNGQLAESYVWLDGLRLGAWIDHLVGTQHRYHYGPDGRVAAVTIASAQRHGTYLLGLDQVGTVRTVTECRNDGRLIKEIAYDSFGAVIYDSNPGVFLPIGFASGLVDRHTGLVRFGFRDYAPEVGRFTALDPAHDMRGDGDLWDYCIDDPVNKIDPWGLEPQRVENRTGAAPTREESTQKDATESWKTSSWNPIRYYTDPEFRKSADAVIYENSAEFADRILSINNILPRSGITEIIATDIMAPAIKRLNQ